MDTLSQDTEYLEIALEHFPDLLLKARKYQKVLENKREDNKENLNEMNIRFFNRMINNSPQEQAFSEMLKDKKKRAILDRVIEAQDFRNKKAKELDGEINRGINKMQASDNTIINIIGRTFAYLKDEFF